MTGRSFRHVAAGLMVIAAAASLILSSTTSAAPPVVTDEPIILGVERLTDGSLFVYPNTGGTSECSGFHRLRLTSADGRTAGTGTVCFNLLLTMPYADFFSWDLTLHLPGGTLEVSSQDCESGYTLGDLGYPIVFALSCMGPITSATGLFADAPGEVTFSYRSLTDVFTGVTTWSPPPTLTIDFA